MRIRHIILSTLTALCSAWTNPLRADGLQSLPGPAEVFVSAPFHSQDSIKAFQTYLGQLRPPISLPPEFWNIAPKMTYWGYTFIPNGRTYDVRFQQKFIVNDAMDAILDAVRNFKQDGCSSYHTEKVHFETISLKKIVAVGSIKGKHRWCDDHLGSTDVGDISGSANLTVTLHTEISGTPNSRYRGRLVFDHPSADISAGVTDLFGINVDSVGGQILNVLISTSLAAFQVAAHPSVQNAEAVINVLNSKAFRFDGNTILDVNFVDQNNGKIVSKKYIDFLKSITGLTWSDQAYFQIEDAETGVSVTEDPTDDLSPPADFGCGSPAPSCDVLTLSFRTTIDESYPIDGVYEDVLTEIQKLQSFSESDSTRVVSKRDTLWSIAKENYGSPFFVHLLGATNGLDARSMQKLRVGKVLTIPPRYKFDLLSSFHFASPGDSLSGLCSRWMPGRQGKCIAAVLAANPQIRKHRIFALEAIKIPAGAIAQ